MPEIEKWIREQFKKGLSEKQVKDSMLKSGWNKSLAEKLIEENKPSSVKSSKINFSKEKNITLASFVLFFAVLVLIYFLILPFTEDLEPQSQSLKSHYSEENYISYCKSLPEKDRPVCFYNAAIENNDTAICNNIDKEENGISYSNLCKDMVISDKAIKKRDENICEQVAGKEQRDGCYMGVARSTGNESLCENVDDKEYCYLAVALSTKNEKLCERVSEDKKDYCYDVILDSD